MTRFLISFLVVCSFAAAQTKPDVLFIAVDDLNDWVTHLGGHSQAKTPNIGRLVKISGPTAGSITNPTAAVATATGMVPGVYRYQLTVPDNAGAIGRDTMQVTVNAALNIPPSANAGPDRTITLPTNTTTLNGSGNDPDGSIASYAWVKISGPGAGTITSPAAAVTTLTGLVQGVYRFQLTVTDNAGAIGRDTVQVTVNPAVNIPSTANAGTNIVITLPTNSTTRPLMQGHNWWVS